MRAILIVLPVFLVIGFGWILKQKNFLSHQTVLEDDNLLYNFVMPLILFRGILHARTDIPDAGAFALSVCLPYFVTTLLVWLLARWGESRERFAAITLSAARGNHFFAVLPVVQLALGDEGFEAGALILAFSLVCLQLLSMGSGELALAGRVSAGNLKRIVLRLFHNPLFMSCLLALLLTLMNLNTLPFWLDTTFERLANIGTGLALLTLGTKINLRGLPEALLTTWKLQLFKIVVHPVVTFLILTLFGLPPLFVQAGTLLAAMPEAVNTTIIAEKMGMDWKYCAMGTTVSVLLSMITLPLGIHLLGAIR